MKPALMGAFLSILGLSLMASFALADTVFTRNFNYNGKIIKESDDSVIILWNGKTRKEIPWKQIKKINRWDWDRDVEAKEKDRQQAGINSCGLLDSQHPKATSASGRSITKDYYSKLLGYARDGDRDTFNRALAEGVVS
ncbi:MAG: hypothetical protein NTX71_08180 [Candidatus Aureabacteria bacterium]|nr:hypothetical protein [Candidatus Auribacterota bacterium]